MQKRTFINWTPQMDHAIAAMVKGGSGRKEIGDVFGLSANQIGSRIQYLRGQGWDIPPFATITKEKTTIGSDRSDYRVTGPEGAPEVGWSIGGGSPATDAWAASLRADGLDVVRVE